MFIIPFFFYTPQPPPFNYYKYWIICKLQTVLGNREGGEAIFFQWKGLRN